MKRKTRMAGLAGLAGAAALAALVGLGGVAHADDGTGTDGTRVTGGGETTDGQGEGNGAPAGFHDNGYPWDAVEDVNGQHDTGAAPADVPIGGGAIDGYHESGLTDGYVGSGSTDNHIGSG